MDLNQRTAAPPERARQRVRVRRKVRRKIGLVALGVVAFVAVLGALSLIPARAAQRHLEAARDHMTAGRDALLAGDARAARARFLRAEERFILGRDQVGNPLLRLAGVLPILGRTPDAVRGMSEAGRDVAQAAGEISTALGALPDGLGSLAPREGRIPLGPFRDLAPPLERAAALLRGADERVARLPDTWLLGPVAEARRAFAGELAGVDDKVQAAALLMERLPAFLGAEGRKRYFFGAGNPAELRGAGGFVGAYAILTVEDGRLSFSDFLPTQDLPNADPDAIPGPNPDYDRRYPGAATFWVNANLTPDFPSAAQAILNLWSEVRGEELDGVIVADPFALEAMMRVTGEVDVPAIGRTVAADDVVALVANRAYALIQDSDARKRLLGDVAKVVVGRFLGGAASPRESAAALTEAAAGGHILMHSGDARMQRGLELAGVAGRLLPADLDYLSVAVNNGGGNKVDYYAQRTLRYAVHLGAEGSAQSRLLLSIENDAPARGQPAYVIGPFRDISAAGENVSQVSLFGAGTARPTAALVDGRPAEVAVGEELGHLAVDTEIRIPSGETRTLDYEVAVLQAWEGTSGDGVYRLTFQDQPTIRPTQLVVDVQAPDGTRIVSATEGMEIRGNRAVWRGDAPQRRVFEIRFRKPFLPRTWDALTRFFSKRVVTF